MEKQLNFYEDLKVDANKLDENVEKQPILYMQYGELASDKRDIVENQKLKVKVKDAELKELEATLHLKFKIQEIEGKKPTDTQVQSLVITSKEYKIKFDEFIKELEKLNKLKYELDILDTAVTSFQQRKNMLEERIKLYQLGYNSQVRQNDYSNKIHDKLNKKEE